VSIAKLGLSTLKKVINRTEEEEILFYSKTTAAENVTSNRAKPHASVINSQSLVKKWDRKYWFLTAKSLV
jgi:hypothetical protein